MDINKLLLIIIIFSLSGNALWAIMFLQPQKSQKADTQPVAEEENKHPFLAKRIFIENPNDIIINFTQIRNDLREFTQKEESMVGIYFEYLPTGITIGINEKEGFRRASLVKIPTVMRIYKLIEEGKLSKQDFLTVRKDQLDSAYGELYKEGEGVKITVGKAVELTLLESDNTAFNMLRDAVNETLIRKAGSDNEILTIYDYLDIPNESIESTLDVSPKKNKH